MRIALVVGIFVFASAARAERLPLQSDLNRCALAAINSGNAAMLQGQLTLELLVRPNGSIYAAYVAGARGVGNRSLQRCVTNAAMLWGFPEARVDYARPYGPISFAPPGADVGALGGSRYQGPGQTAAEVMLPDANSNAATPPLVPELAQGTLDLDEKATLAEQAEAQRWVGLFPDAIKNFRAALQQNGADALALRGLASALADSGGDLREARALAEKLVANDPQSVNGHEAMVRVCLVQKDVRCVVENWRLALKAPDFSPRSRIFREQLEYPVKQIAADARQAGGPTAAGQAAGQVPAGQQPAPADPCAAETTPDGQALCLVRRCLDVGSTEYARELSAQNKVEYVPGAWHAKVAGVGRVVVTRDIATATAPRQEHNPMWLVKMGEQVVMQPTNAEARQITLTHNACAARVSQ